MYQETELVFAGRGNGKVIQKEISAELTRVVQKQPAILKAPPAGRNALSTT